MKSRWPETRPTGKGFWGAVALLTLIFLILYLLLVGGIITLAWNTLVNGTSWIVLSWGQGTAIAALFLVFVWFIRSMKGK